MNNPVRAFDARTAQAVRDNQEFARQQAYKAALELERLQKLADDLQALGFLGLGGGLSLEDVQDEIDQALTGFLTSNDFETALSSYVTSSALTTALSSYVTSGALTDTLYLYVTQDERAQDLATYVTNSALTTILTNYVTSGALASALSSYVSQTALNAALSVYVTSGALTTTLSSYVTSGALTTTLSSYVTSSALNSAIANFVTSSALTTALSNYVTNATLTTNLQNYITSGALTTALSSYVTSGALTTTLSSYVTSSALTTALSSYVTSSALTTTLANYTKRGTTNTLSATSEAVNCTNIILNGVENVAINCKNFWANDSQKNAVFLNMVNSNQQQFARLPKHSTVEGNTAGLKQVKVKSVFNGVKNNNASLVFADTDGIKLPLSILSGSGSVHDIKIFSYKQQGVYSKRRAIYASGVLTIFNDFNDVVGSGGIGLSIAITDNAGSLNISVAMNLNTAQDEMFCEVESLYHLV